MFGAIASALSNPIVGKIAGSVGGSLLGNMMGRQDRGNIDYANQMSNAGYLAAEPYLKDLYQRGKGALDSSLNTGAYMGDTYAGMNPLMTDGYNNMATLGNTAFGDASNFMNISRGFGQNYADLYNQASENMLDNAINYASNNADPLIRAAMRDDYRNLMENQLPQTGLASSATGNTNSSRRGVAEAVLERGYQDRMADTTADIQNDLISRSLTEQQNRFGNMTTANNNLGNMYNNAFDLGMAGTGALTDAGNAFRTDEQNRMNDTRDRFERNRDFELDQLARYNAGILSRAPTSSSPYAPNMVNPLAAGLSGGMAGMGFGNRLSNYFARPAVYGGGSYGTTGATGMSNILPYTDNYGFGVG